MPIETNHRLPAAKDDESLRQELNHSGAGFSLQPTSVGWIRRNAGPPSHTLPWPVAGRRNRMQVGDTSKLQSGDREGVIFTRSHFQHSRRTTSGATHNAL